MSAESKKLLWISISACAFVLILLAAGFLLFPPKKGSSQAPATIGNSAPPKAQDPQDFLSAPPPVPALEQPRNQDGNVIIVYGDKPAPAAVAGAAAGAGSSAAAGAGSSKGTTGVVPATGTSGTNPAANAVPPPSAMSASDGAKASTAATAGAAGSKAGPAKASATKTAATKASGAVAPKQAATKVDEYWIQAASFTSRGRADELKQALAEKGVAALISVKDISGKSWYRVRIGPYPTKVEADGWLGRLKGIPGCAEAYASKTVAAQKN